MHSLSLSLYNSKRANTSTLVAIIIETLPFRLLITHWLLTYFPFRFYWMLSQLATNTRVWQFYPDHHFLHLDSRSCQQASVSFEACGNRNVIVTAERLSWGYKVQLSALNNIRQRESKLILKFKVWVINKGNNEIYLNHTCSAWVAYV